MSALLLIVTLIPATFLAGWCLASVLHHLCNRSDGHRWHLHPVYCGYPTLGKDPRR